MKSVNQRVSKEKIRELLTEHEVPEWYADAKFGIFIHYGIYSEPAYGDEWYGHWMYMPGTTSWGGSNIYQYHIDTYGGAIEHGYKSFIPDFVKSLQNYKAENKAEEWADVFYQSGAKYVMPVGIHHDSFALYDSDIQTTYNSVTQAGVDYIEDLQKAVKSKGMKFGISNHFAENDWFFDEEAAIEGADIKETLITPDEMYGDGKAKSEWHIKKWFNISMEIINKYNPDMIYYDFDLDQSSFMKYDEANRELMLANFYNQAKANNLEGVVCNYKGIAFETSQAVLDKERVVLGQINNFVWQTDTSIGEKSWGYTTDEVYRKGEEFIGALVDIVSKNGNLLLNVGPQADGTIPDDAKEALLTIGNWLNAYGDAIYATRPWLVYGEGPTKNVGDSYALTQNDIRFTRNKNNTILYATALARPTTGKMNITTLNKRDFDGSQIDNISLINGSDRIKLTYEHSDEALSITLPMNSKIIKGAYSVELTFKNGYIPSISVDSDEQIGNINYTKSVGNIIGAESFDYKNGSLRVESTTDPEGGNENLGYVSVGDCASYNSVDFEDGVTEFVCRMASQQSEGLEVYIDSLEGQLICMANNTATGGWNNYQTFHFPITEEVTGKHDVYIVFKSITNLNWFSFNK